MQDIKGRDNYQVTEDGNIWSKRRSKFLKQSRNTNGYSQVSIDGNKGNVVVHRLVAIAFIPNPENLPEVNHKDGNKQNNNKSNLEWCTRLHNVRHSIEKGLHRPGGKKEPVLKIKDGQILKRYDSAVDAHKDGFLKSGISTCASGKRKSYKGFQWEKAQ